MKKLLIIAALVAVSTTCHAGALPLLQHDDAAYLAAINAGQYEQARQIVLRIGRVPDVEDLISTDRLIGVREFTRTHQLTCDQLPNEKTCKHPPSMFVGP